MAWKSRQGVQLSGIEPGMVSYSTSTHCWLTTLTSCCPGGAAPCWSPAALAQQMPASPLAASAGPLSAAGGCNDAGRPTCSDSDSKCLPTKCHHPRLVYCGCCPSCRCGRAAAGAAAALRHQTHRGCCRQGCYRYAAPSSAAAGGC